MHENDYSARKIREDQFAGYGNSAFSERFHMIRFAPITFAVCFSCFAIAASAAEGDPFRSGWGNNLTPGERTELGCRGPKMPIQFSAPTRIYPSPETPFELIYSPESDLVRLTGDETEAIIVLGAGDDVVLLYDIGDGTSVRGDSGADTILLCSMNGLAIDITLGTESPADDKDADVVIIDGSVFENVQQGLFRVVAIFSFDQRTDKLIIHAPEELIASRQASPAIGGIRIGAVHFAVYGTPYNQSPDYNGDAFIFVPSGDR